MDSDKLSGSIFFLLLIRQKVSILEIKKVSIAIRKFIYSVINIFCLCYLQAPNPKTAEIKLLYREFNV